MILSIRYWYDPVFPGQEPIFPVQAAQPPSAARAPLHCPVMASRALRAEGSFPLPLPPVTIFAASFIPALCFPQRGKLPPVRTLEGDEGDDRIDANGGGNTAFLSPSPVSFADILPRWGKNRGRGTFATVYECAAAFSFVIPLPPGGASPSPAAGRNNTRRDEHRSSVSPVHVSSAGTCSGRPMVGPTVCAAQGKGASPSPPQV